MLLDGGHRDFLYLVLVWVVCKMECWRLAGEGPIDCMFWCLAWEHLGDVGDHHAIVL